MKKIVTKALAVHLNLDATLASVYQPFLGATCGKTVVINLMSEIAVTTHAAHPSLDVIAANVYQSKDGVTDT